MQPHIRISWLVRDIFEPFVRACQTVHETIPYDRNGGWSALQKLRMQLSQRHFDAVIDLQGLLRSGLMTYFAQAPRKIGRSDAREGAGFFYKEKAPLPVHHHPHAVEILLQFLPLLGAEPKIQGSLKFNTQDFSQTPLSHVTEGAIVIFPDSRRKEKQWHGFEALTHWALRMLPQYTIVWSADRSASEPCQLENKPRFIDLRGLLPIEAMPALIERARLVIANDSGPMHLAAAMGKPVLGIFGPTDPLRYGPYPLKHPNHHIIQAPGKDLSRLTVDTVSEFLLNLGLID